MLAAMSESALNPIHHASETIHPEDDMSPTICFSEVQGFHSLVELVYRGIVRLHGECGATVDVSEPESLGEDRHRVNLTVNFSEEMKQRYPEPLPNNPTSVINYPKYVEPGRRNFDGCNFRVEGWGVGKPVGKRIRQDSLRFVLRKITKIELGTVGDVEEMDRPGRNGDPNALRG